MVPLPCVTICTLSKSTAPTLRVSCYAPSVRKLLGFSLLVGAAACGGSKGESKLGPTSGPSVAADDLHIPKVDPSLCATDGKKVAVYDLNRDGKPDLWKLYEVKDEKGTKVE